MSGLLWLLLVLFVILALVFIIPYNRFVTLRNRCRESWANVDTELKRRHDLVPNLVKAVKGYMAHERAVLESVTAARTRAMAPHQGAADQERDERPLSAALKTLFAVAEGYPDLKASANFLRLQEELAITEDRIQAARRFYNGNVRDYRNATRTFPGHLFARLYGFAEEPFFQVETAVRHVPHVQLAGAREA